MSTVEVDLDNGKHICLQDLSDSLTESVNGHAARAIAAAATAEQELYPHVQAVNSSNNNGGKKDIKGGKKTNKQDHYNYSLFHKLRGFGLF